MFGKKKKPVAKRPADPVADNSSEVLQETPITTEKEKYMPDGTPFPDFEIAATDGNISLLKEQDEIIQKLTEQIQHSKNARRQIVRTIVSSQPKMPPEAELVFDYFPDVQAVRVYKKTTLQAAQLAAQERAAAVAATKGTETYK